MLATELYAKHFSITLKGHSNCHWCGALCDGTHHSDDPVIPHIKTKSGALHPANPWLCAACAYYRNKGKQSITTLSNIMLDSKTLRELSWLITPVKLNGIILPQDTEPLVRFLLDPPSVFCLGLMNSPCQIKHQHTRQCSLNRLERAFVNQSDEWKQDSSIRFTLDNVLFTYVIWELDEALKSGNSSGTESGTQELLRLLGKQEFLIREQPPEEKRQRGRPRKEVDEDVPLKQRKR